MNSFKNGTILSYSAGTTNGDPYGFRVIQPSNEIMDAVVKNFPALTRVLQAMPIIINCYPASLLQIPIGVFIESFLSPKTVSRALSLAALEKLPAVLIGQPLFLADVLTSHVKKGGQIPDRLVIVSGGYYLPQSLENYMRSLAPKSDVFILTLYGIAEVDSAIMISTQRHEDLNPIYFPRSANVQFSLNGSDLSVTLKSSQGALLMDNFATGDKAKSVNGGYIVWNEKRLSETVRKELEAWNTDLWTRRTGYLGKNRTGRYFQLRKGLTPSSPEDMDYFAFMAEFDVDFLSKPTWNV